MIFTLDWLHKQDTQGNPNKTKPNHDRPSYREDIRLRLPGLVEEFHIKNSDLCDEYPLLVDPTTNIVYGDSKIYYESDFNQLEFKSLKVGKFDIKEKIWEHAWVNAHDDLVVHSEAMIFRGYGFRNGVGPFTKSRWYADIMELVELLSLFFKLKSAIGLDIQQVNDYQYFYLLLSEVEKPMVKNYFD